MKIQTFLEWTNQREVEETARHAWSRDTMSQADPKQGDIVITNAKSFMTSLITPARGKLKNDGKSTIGKQGVSKATIAGFSDGKPVIRSTSFEGKPMMIRADELLDVTPAFDDGGGLFSQLDTRQGVFIWNRPRSKNYTSQSDVKAMWERWWQQVARPQADAEMTRVGGVLDPSGNLAKQQQRGLGGNERSRNAQEVVDLIKGFKKGEPGNVPYPQLLQIMKGMVEDEWDVKWLRKNGYSDIVDTLHDSGMSSLVAGEEQGAPTTATMGQPEANPAGIEDLFNQPQQQPGVIPTDPAALQARGQTVGGHEQPDDGEDFWNRIAQQRQVSWYDPWKHHKDKKVYAYYD